MLKQTYSLVKINDQYVIIFYMYILATFPLDCQLISQI